MLSTVIDWLNWIKKGHSQSIILGLERVAVVGQRLNLLPMNCPTIVVAGTNGKGSTVTALATIYRIAGYRVGSFTSPYLIRFNEQIMIDGVEVTDEYVLAAFVAVENARGNIHLTPFEFTTLAALYIFRAAQLDVQVLEVGLGGRLDAVNIVDADLALITNIAIDHVDFLGHTREQIAVEKAGIMRWRQPVIYGDPAPVDIVLTEAQRLNTDFYLINQDFTYQPKHDGWDWHSRRRGIKFSLLPYNQLAVSNMANVVMAISLLQDKLPVTADQLSVGLRTTKLKGRIEAYTQNPWLEIHDVAHNPAAVTFLREHVLKLDLSGKIYAVFSMLADKDINESILILKDIISTWLVAPLNVERETSIEKLHTAFAAAGISQVNYYPTIERAYFAAHKLVESVDLILVFGSFHTVAQVLASQAAKARAQA